MSKFKKPTNGATPPPIVAAKMQKTAATPATTSNVPQPLPPGVTEEPSSPMPKKSVADYATKRLGEDEAFAISKQLRKADPSVVSGAFTSSRMEAIEKEGARKVNEAKAKGDKSGQVEFKIGKEFLPSGAYLDKVLTHAYNEAEKKGIKTAGEFSTRFSELIHGADKDALEYLNKYGGGEKNLYRTGPAEYGYGRREILDLDKLPLHAGAHFQNMMRERDAEDKEIRSKRPPAGTVTDMSGTPSTNASYMNRAVYEKEKAPAGIKLSVKKK